MVSAFLKIKHTYQTHILCFLNTETCYLNHGIKCIFFFVLWTLKTCVSTTFFNYNFHIILNNNFWNLLPNKPLINMLDLQNNFKIISILKWQKQIQKIMEKKEEREFRNPHVQHVATIYKNKKNFSITKQIRASTSMDAKNLYIYTSKTYFFYFTLQFLQNTHINLSIIHIYSNKIL